MGLPLPLPSSFGIALGLRFEGGGRGGTCSRSIAAEKRAIDACCFVVDAQGTTPLFRAPAEAIAARTARLRCSRCSRFGPSPALVASFASPLLNEASYCPLDFGRAFSAAGSATEAPTSSRTYTRVAALGRAVGLQEGEGNALLHALHLIFQLRLRTCARLAAEGGATAARTSL